MKLYSMKLNLICGLCILAVCVSLLAFERDTPVTLKRGTNIAHWLSQSDRRGDERAAFFTRKDIDYIHSAGFDHIRLPIDEVQLWDETGKRHDEAFELMKHGLEWG